MENKYAKRNALFGGLTSLISISLRQIIVPWPNTHSGFGNKLAVTSMHSSCADRVSVLNVKDAFLAGFKNHPASVTFRNNTAHHTRSFVML